MSEFLFFIIGTMLGGLFGVACMCCLQISRLSERKWTMRKRNVQILFRLTEEEAEHLNELVRKSGRSKEAFLREMVRGYQLCEKPDPEFYKMMRELSAIGNRINQLAVKANALGFVDTPMLREEARKWHEFQIDIRKRYLLPRRSS
jgi:hypothetical protein